ncbi:MAG: peptidoglycan bridge formation glycyltransferase FemA/FemB family protein, partial [Bacteroidetes bacterium]|nr:peptidoglycan bridge formation glycyltransferase FemA/FemB family protein [Bacteroidota bacterium]
QSKGNQNIKIYYSVIGGQRIAAILVACFFDSCHYLAGWNSELGKNFCAHNFLLWHAIENCKLMGFNWFDMGGIDPINHPSISAFKRGVGGEEYSITGEWRA